MQTRNDSNQKFITIDGCLRKNPNYIPPAGTAAPKPTTLLVPDKAFTVVSTTDDLTNENNRIPIAPNTNNTMMQMMSPEYVKRFDLGENPTVDGGDMLEGVSRIFDEYETPIGLISKLMELLEYRLNFIIDDSGSMATISNIPIEQASPAMQGKFKWQIENGKRRPPTMTRWEEAEDRLHIMIDILAYIPTQPIKIRFLNRANPIELNHKGLTPAQFAQDAHQKIFQAFAQGPASTTPMKKKLIESFNEANQNRCKTMHYLFTDGVPDEDVEDIKKLILTRNSGLTDPNQLRMVAALNPFTFVSTTSVDADVAWGKDLDELGPFIAEVDDFLAERKEVFEAHGPTFPFSRGLWMLCLILAAINPFDLDAIDSKKAPFSRKTLSEIMGRILSEQEMMRYLETNPNAAPFKSLFGRFINENATGLDIVEGKNSQQSYSQTSSGYSQPQQSAPQQQTQAGYYGQQPTAQSQAYPQQQPQSGYYGQQPTAQTYPQATAQQYAQQPQQYAGYYGQQPPTQSYPQPYAQQPQQQAGYYGQQPAAQSYPQQQTQQPYYQGAASQTPQQAMYGRPSQVGMFQPQQGQQAYGQQPAPQIDPSRVVYPGAPVPRH